MKSKGFAKLFLATILLVGTNSHAVTLAEAYKAAVEKTETVNIAKSQLRGSEAKTDQAFSGFLPNLSLKGDYLYQSEKIGTSTNNDQSDTRLNLTQSLLAGGQNRALYKSSQLQQRSAEYNVDAVKNELYSEVAKSFYTLMSAKKEVDNIDISIQLVQKRIAELEKFKRVGKSRDTEVLAVKAQIAVLEAQKVAAIADRRIAKNNFSDLTSLDRNSELTDSTTLPEKLDPLKDYLQTVDKRPDLLSLKSFRDSADYTIDAYKAGHWPSLDLGGNYYFSHGGAPNSAQDADDWNATLTLTLPLYSGGSVSSQVTQATEQKIQADLSYQKRLRDDDADVRTTYNTLISAVEQIKALEVALKATEENYNEQEKDYRFKLVNNLDVLEALNTFQDTKRTLDRTRFSALSAWAQLQAKTNKIQ